MSPHVVLDTSVLLDLLSDRGLRARFCREVSNRKLTVVVPLLALDEAFVRHAAEERLPKAEALRELVSTISVDCLDGLPKLVVAEHIFNGLAGTPLEPRVVMSTLVEMLNDSGGVLDGRVGTSATHVREWKRASLDRDRRFKRAKRRAEPNSPRSALSLIEGISLQSMPTWILGATLQRCYESAADPIGAAIDPPHSVVPAIVQSRRLTVRVPEDELLALPMMIARRPILLAWSALALMGYAANLATRSEISAFPRLNFLKRDKNDFFDANIAPAAAYAQLFLTKDEGLRNRCEFLRERSLLSFRSSTLEHFLLA